MSLAYYYRLLGEKQYQLQRLENCSNQLHIQQQEFIAYEKMLIQPTLTTNTWRGRLADKFDQTRNEQMLTIYQELDVQQFNAVYRVIGDKMNSLKDEISEIKQIIRTLEAEEAAKREKSK